MTVTRFQIFVFYHFSQIVQKHGIFTSCLLPGNNTLDGRCVRYPTCVDVMGTHTNFYRVHSNDKSNRICVWCITHVSVRHRNNTDKCDYNQLGHFLKLLLVLVYGCVSDSYTPAHVVTFNHFYFLRLLPMSTYMYECHIRCSCICMYVLHMLFKQSITQLFYNIS